MKLLLKPWEEAERKWKGVAVSAEGEGKGKGQGQGKLQGWQAVKRKSSRIRACRWWIRGG